jgi:hypothetical protein
MTGIVRKSMKFCDFVWNGISKNYDHNDNFAEICHQMQTGKQRKTRSCSSGAVYKTTLISAIATTALLTARSLASCSSEATSLTCVQLDYLVQASLIIQFSSIGILVIRNWEDQGETALLRN